MNYRLSQKAKADLQQIARYTVEQFGFHQSESYRDGFKACFQTLCANPNIGRDYSHIRKNIRRFDHNQHSIFYLVQDQYLFIVRILHNKQDAATQLIK